MKLIRTTTAIPYGRKNESIILAMAINLEWQEDFGRWVVSIKEFKQIERINPEPGTPLFSYIPLLQQNGEVYEKKIRTSEQVNALFSQFGITIAPEDNLTDKFRHVIALSAIYENQVNPPYTVNPAELEMIDTNDEIVPNI